ncbi:MAG TPA: glycosyltransferase [Terriglobales bacterium]|jgi:hypothetical protein|nr:glycosyltransferase [Terriglobales bacterium]
MKRVAIVGADFAPSSMPPALRIRFFASHLREFGWQPIVITTDPSQYETALDPDMARLVPESVEVIRTPALPSRLTRLFGIGDLGMRSMWHHWRVLKQLCADRRVDLVFIPVPPYAPMVLGRLAHERFGIPYVIDYIDPWASEFYWKLPRSRRPPKWILAYALARLLEPFAVRHAAHIVGVSKGTTDSVRARYPRLGEDDASEIPYGGETADWEYIRGHRRSNSIFDAGDGLLHVCSVGAYTAAMRPVLAALFRAVRLGVSREAEIFSRLRLHFVGTSYAGGSTAMPVSEIAREEGVADLVEERPQRVPYLDALQLLADARGLLVVGSEERHYTASKIFPYILAKKPLLVIFHSESSVVPIVTQTKAGSMVTFDGRAPLATKAEEISQQLEAMLRLPEGYEPATDWQAFDAYTTRQMAGRLVDVFARALAKNTAQWERAPGKTRTVKV